MAGRHVALVDVDADRIFSGGGGSLQHALARRAGDVVDDVRTLAVERHGQLRALGRIVEGTGEDAVDADVGRGGLGAGLVAAEEVTDDGDVAAADKADRLAVAHALDGAALLGHQRGERAGQERALVLREIGIDDLLGIEHAVDEHELGVRIGGGGLLQRVDQLPAHDEDEIVFAGLADIVELLFVVERAVAGVDQLHFDAEIGLGLLEAVDDRHAEALGEIARDGRDRDVLGGRGRGGERERRGAADRDETTGPAGHDEPYPWS